MGHSTLVLLVLTAVFAVAGCNDEPDVLHEFACKRLDLYGGAVAGTFFSGPGPVEPNNAENWLVMVEEDELSPEIKASRFGDELEEYRQSVWHALSAARAGGEWDDPGQLLQAGQSLWSDWNCSDVERPTEWSTLSVTTGDVD